MKMIDDDGEDQFLVTKEYKRFREFCEACIRYKYIGLCYGPPGVGKTLSAKYYSRWGLIEEYSRLDYQRSQPLNLYLMNLKSMIQSFILQKLQIALQGF
jgi:DNA transposition AAA+ family ATPase